MLLIHDLSLKVAKEKLFSNLNISIFPSAILYITGPNGCGKTSLLRLIAGIQKLEEGKIILNNKSIYDISKPYCLYVGHDNGFKKHLTIYESLKFWTNIYDSAALLEASIEYFGLREIIYKKYYELSEGNKRKASMARIVACHSDLWLLDEIDVNLDKNAQDLLNNLIISKANNGGIILISTHNAISINTAQILDLKDYLI